MPRNPTVREGQKGTPVNIDADLYEHLRRAAEADERSVCRYLNRVLRHYLGPDAERGRLP